MSMIWSSRERNRSCSPPSRRSRGRIANLPLHQFEREESRLAIRGNPQNPICKEIALQRSKTGKFDYFSTPNQPARSRDSEFFTDDWTTTGFPAPVPAKAGPMPADEGLGADDRDRLEHRWKPSIQLDQEQANPGLPLRRRQTPSMFCVIAAEWS
jgi:hypothetical protein